MIIADCHRNQRENGDLLGFVIEKGDFLAAENICVWYISFVLCVIRGPFIIIMPI